MKKDFAFTLAEVLITLGIIGVVAAITLPSLIHKYKIKVLENQFKKTSSTIEQAVRATAIEYSMENYFYPTPGVKMPKISNEERSKMNFFFKQQFKSIQFDNQSIFSKITKCERFNGDKCDDNIGVGYSWVYHYDPILLSDGSMISSMVFQLHNSFDGIKVWFDTNGPFKGPNRVGYDLFVYNTGSWNYTACPLEVGVNQYYYYGCYGYAQKNIMPNDKTKKYWDNLK